MRDRPAHLLHGLDQLAGARLALRVHERRVTKHCVSAGTRAGSKRGESADCDQHTAWPSRSRGWRCRRSNAAATGCYHDRNVRYAHRHRIVRGDRRGFELETQLPAELRPASVSASALRAEKTVL